MIEDRNKFYLADRWFYKIKENEETITYSSKPNNLLAGITLEYNKNDNSITILYFKNKTLLSKISVSNLNDPLINFHYLEKEPQIITIKDNEYVNLILEATSKIKYGRKIEKDKIIIKRKRILKKLCYREPDFPIDTEIDMDSIEIKSPYLDYFKKIVNSISMYNLKIKETLENEQSTTINQTSNVIKQLNIPNELFYYDRNYTFIKHESNRIIYKNTEDGEYTLEIEHDFNYNFLTDITLKIKENTVSKKNDLILTVTSSNKGGTIVNYKTNKRINIKLSTKNLEDALFNGTYTFDKNGKMLSNDIIISSKTDIETYPDNQQKILSLKPVPTFTNLYVDENGNEYRINNSEFATLSMMAKFSSNILKNFEKVLTK